MTDSIFEDAQDEAELGVKELMRFRKEIQPYLSQKVPGARRMDDSQFLDWVAVQRRRLLPRPMPAPDGTLVFESPAIIALMYIDGEKDDYDRYVRLLGKPPILPSPDEMLEGDLP